MASNPASEDEEPMEEEVDRAVEASWSEAVKREDADLADAVMRSSGCCEVKPR